MNKYDRIIQENIRPLTLSLIKKILGIRNAEITILPRKLQRTLEKETDLVILVSYDDGRKVIYNVEWQTYNDPGMSFRMLLQQSVLYSLYKKPVTGIVIYTGREKMSMKDVIFYDGFYYKYNLIDLSRYDPGDFLDSEVPDEIIMAILAGKPKAVKIRSLVKNILIKLHALLGDNVEELNRKIRQLEILSEIRGFQGAIIEEEKYMPIILDDSKSIRFQQGLKKGMEKATKERNSAFVKYLLQNTSHTLEEIAKLVGVPLDFVLQAKDKFIKRGGA